jgi:hypothetical protein
VPTPSPRSPLPGPAGPATSSNPCGPNHEVWVAADQGNGAAGTVYYPLEFTNISTQTCILFGFPGVSAVSSSGQQLGPAAVWDSAVAPRTVQLAPGATGYALLGYSDVITSNCPSAYKVSAYELRVIPPDQFQSDHAYWPLVTCTAPRYPAFLSVRVIAPGVGVRGDSG